MRDSTNIKRAVQAIMSPNGQKGHAFDDKWHIFFPVVQTLLRTDRLSTKQKNVATVFEQLKDDLEHHRNQHAISSKHNRCYSVNSL